MKVLLSVLCLVSYVAGGAVSWPGALTVSAPLVRTVLPAHTKSFAYSTTQYINSIPSAAYSIGPQFTYQIPQYSAFSFGSPYYPIASASYYPATSVFYPGASPITPVAPIAPAAPIAPTQPQAPEGSFPNAPAQQPQGDSDSEVIDSAKLDQTQQSPSPSPIPSQPPAFPPASTFPNFPTFPQAGDASFPQFPQLPQLPQFPGFPQLPSNPIFPQSPSTPPPATYPGSSNEDKGLNDEDTISVESA